MRLEFLNMSNAQVLEFLTLLLFMKNHEIVLLLAGNLILYQWPLSSGKQWMAPVIVNFMYNNKLLWYLDLNLLSRLFCLILDVGNFYTEFLSNSSFEPRQFLQSIYLLERYWLCSSQMCSWFKICSTLSLTAIWLKYLLVTKYSEIDYRRAIILMQ